jgi:hypothetical protein
MNNIFKKEKFYHCFSLYSKTIFGFIIMLFLISIPMLNPGDMFTAVSLQSPMSICGETGVYDPEKC